VKDLNSDVRSVKLEPMRSEALKVLKRPLVSEPD